MAERDRERRGWTFSGLSSATPPHKEPETDPLTFSHFLQTILSDRIGDLDDKMSNGCHLISRQQLKVRHELISRRYRSIQGLWHSTGSLRPLGCVIDEDTVQHSSSHPPLSHSNEQPGLQLSTR